MSNLIADTIVNIGQKIEQNKNNNKTDHSQHSQMKKECCPCSQNNLKLIDIIKQEIKLTNQTNIDLIKALHQQILHELKNIRKQIVQQTKKQLQKIFKDSNVSEKKQISAKPVQNIQNSEKKQTPAQPIQNTQKSQPIQNTQKSEKKQTPAQPIQNTQLKQQKLTKNLRSYSIPKLLKIGTLNYSGVLTSPFQFHQTQDKDQIQLNNIFLRIVSQKYPFFHDQKEFTWDMGSVDTKWNNRYTPINVMQLNPPVGINSHGKIMSQEEFLKQWDKYKDETLSQLIKIYFQQKYEKDKLQQRIKIQVERTRDFDLFCYKAIIQKIYGADAFKNCHDLPIQKYIQFRKKYFDKPYLDTKMKIQTTITDLLKLQLDVVNFEETSIDLVDELKKLPNYQCVLANKGNSVILLNRKSFGIDHNTDFKQENEEFYKQYKLLSKNPDLNIDQKLGFNKDSAFQALGNYLFFCLHISSKKDKNSQQFQQVKNLIQQIHKIMPNKNIIIGGDFNRQIFEQDVQFSNNPLNIFPIDPNIKTVKKKRTLLQPQRHKALKLDQTAKDYIISNLEIVNGKCIMINGKQVSGHLELLPNINHPYDHFMIYAELKAE